jgi:hypothetical protein
LRETSKTKVINWGLRETSKTKVTQKRNTKTL